MSDIFVSYSHKDKDFARRLCDALSAHGHFIWIDRTQLYGSAPWKSDIQAGIENSSIFVPILSHQSIVSESCHDEITRARELGIPILPIALQQKPELETTFATLSLDNNFKTRNDPQINWKTLGDVQWIFFDFDKDKGVVSENELNLLIGSILKISDYAEDRSHYLVRTLLWQKKDQDPSYLLRGSELNKARAWLRTNEKENILIEKFIEASRKAEKRRFLLQVSSIFSIVFAILLIIAFIVFTVSTQGLVSQQNAVVETAQSNLESLYVSATQISAANSYSNGVANYNSGEFQNAQRFLSAAVASNALDDSAALFLTYAQTCLQLQDYACATQNYNKTVSIDDKQIGAYIGWAIALRELKDYKIAGEKLTQAQKLNDNHPDAVYSYLITRTQASLAYYQGNWSEVLTILQPIVDTTRIPDVYRQEVLFYAAASHQQRNQKDDPTQACSLWQEYNKIVLPTFPPPFKIKDRTAEAQKLMQVLSCPK